MTNKELIRFSYRNIPLDKLYSLERLHPEWYKYIIYTDEIIELYRSVCKYPSGKEYLKDNKGDYQQIKYKVYGMDIVQYINLKTGHHVYECEGHYFWELYDNIHKSIDDFPIFKAGLREAIKKSTFIYRVDENGHKIWQDEMLPIGKKISHLLISKYHILHPIGGSNTQTLY